MANSLIFVLCFLGLFGIGLDQSLADHNTNFENLINRDSVDNETAAQLFEVYQLIRDKRREESIATITTITDSLDESIPALVSANRKLKRVRVYVKQKQWNKAQQNFRGVLDDLYLMDEYQKIHEGSGCQDDYSESLYNCDVSFGTCIQFISTMESCFIIFNTCQKNAQKKLEQCLVD